MTKKESLLALRLLAFKQDITTLEAQAAQLAFQKACIVHKQEFNLPLIPLNIDADLAALEAQEKAAK